MRAFPLKIERVSYYNDRYYRLLLAGDTLGLPKKLKLPSVTTYLDVHPKPWLIPFYRDFGRNAEVKAKLARDRGSMVHYAAYWWTLGKAVIYDPPVETGLYDVKEAAARARFEADRKGVGYLVIEDEDTHHAIERYQAAFNAVRPKKVRGLELVVWDALDLFTAGTLDAVWEMPEEGEYPIAGSKSVVIPKGIGVVDYKTGREDTGLGRDGERKSASSHFSQLAVYAKLLELTSPSIFKVDWGMVIYLDADTNSGWKCVVKTVEEMNPDLRYFMSIKDVWWANNGNKIPPDESFENVLFRTDDIEEIMTGLELTPTVSRPAIVLETESAKDLTSQLEASIAKEEKKAKKAAKKNGGKE